MKSGIFSVGCLMFLSASISAQVSYYSYTLENFRESKDFNKTIDPQHPDTQRLNAILFYLTNETRAQLALPLLKYHSKLEVCASQHSQSMASLGFFDHINKKNRSLRTPDDRATAAGIANPHMAENIIESFVLKYTAGVPVYPDGPGVFKLQPEDDPIVPHTYLSLGEALMEGWMNSPTHKANILLSQALELGCGTAFYTNKDFNHMPTVIATQNFQLYEPIRITK
ncbi:MAG: CAP domain-containing protein [Bacteroidales bacterium]|nr:CAP domain-containing protein [Bacteroidales bacterium]